MPYIALYSNNFISYMFYLFIYFRYSKITPLKIYT